MSYRITITDNSKHRTLFDEDVVAYGMSTCTDVPDVKINAGYSKARQVEFAGVLFAFQDAIHTTFLQDPELKELFESAMSYLVEARGGAKE